MTLRTESSLSTHTKLAREHRQILDAITSTKEELTRARAAQEQRRAQLGELEADAALQTLKDPGALGRARTASREANESIEHLETRLNALTTKLRTVNERLLELEPSIEAERFELIEKRLSRWREEYRKAAKVFHQVILVGQALGTINSGVLAHTLASVHAPDPQSDENLLYTGIVRREGGIDRHDVEFTWERNDTAAREHRSLRSETKELDDALAVIKELRTRAGMK